MEICNWRYTRYFRVLDLVNYIQPYLVTRSCSWPQRLKAPNQHPTTQRPITAPKIRKGKPHIQHGNRVTEMFNIIQHELSKVQDLSDKFLCPCNSCRHSILLVFCFHLSYPIANCRFTESSICSWVRAKINILISL